MSKDEAKSIITKLIEKYELVKNSNLISKYTEEETKKDFILPLFKALGWDVDNKKEVTAEEHQSMGRVDYGFYLESWLKFYLEAKSLGSNLHKEEFANQAVRYSWNKGATWAILTDFEGIKVFNAQDIERSLGDKLFFEIPYTQYLERFDQLWLLSKDSFQENLLDKEAEKFGKKFQKIAVTTLLYKDFDNCRQILTDNLSQWNDNLDKDLLDEGVQKLLDRLIFLRVAEDRNIEPPTLIPLIRDWENNGRKGRLYESMVKKFRELDLIYNSGLFSEHPFESWDEYSNATEKVINILYGKKGYYEYDFKAMPADVLGTVYENYLGYRLNKSKKGISIGKDAKKRKEHGIYYTPTFIVDYIVKNTLKPVLDKCHNVGDLKKIKVLDPACGSGSFLIKALDTIYEKYLDFGNNGGVFTKLDILLNNIYGVDLDPQAVEITRLNLLISALDQRMKLPVLDKNIRNGNSLVSGTDEELTKYFGKNYKDKKPFNWEEEFPEVFAQGGFDVIISNPPYIDSESMVKTMPETRIYINDKYPLAKGNWDIYIAFFNLGFNLINDNGVLSFITPDKWLSKPFGDELRKQKIDNLVSIARAGRSVFSDAKVDSIIATFTSKKEEKLNIMEFEKDKIILICNINKKTITPPFFVDYLFSKNTTLLSKIESVSNKLSDFGTCQNACATSDAYKLAPLVHELEEHFDKSKYFKIVNTGTIGKYFSKWGLQNMTYLGKKYKKPIVDKELFAKIFHNSYSSKSSLRKIIIKGLNLLDAFIDIDGNNIPGKSTMIVTGGSITTLNMLLVLINSKLAMFYIREKYPAASYNQGTTFTKEMINSFPVPRNIFEDKEIQLKLILLINKIKKLNVDLFEIPENSEKWKSVKQELERVGKKINEETYTLYGLGEEEIKIVEKTIK